MEDTVQILVAVAVIYVAYSWLFKAKPDDAARAPGGASASTSAGGPVVLGRGAFRHVSESMVDNVAAAFPDVPRNNIIYDLARTRSAQATVEKLLTTGFLPAPPPGVFPPPAPAAPQSSGASSAGTSTTATGGSSTPAAGKPQTLIDRFGLHARLPSPSPSSSSSSFASLSSKGKERATADDADAGGSGAIKGNAAKWEASADAREASLTRRKEEMVLEARRKLLARRAKQAEAAAAAAAAATDA